MKKVQVNYLEAKAAMELKMEAFYKECSKIEAKYNIEDDEQFEKNV